MVVGHVVSEAHEKKTWNLRGLLNYFLRWTCFVEKFIIEQASRRTPPLWISKQYRISESFLLDTVV